MYKVSINSYIDVYYNKAFNSFVLDNQKNYYHWLTLKKQILSSNLLYTMMCNSQVREMRNLVLSFYVPHISLLDIIGLGYRVFLTQSLIKLKIGLSHSVFLLLDKYVSIKFLSKTRLLFFGVFKNKVSNFINSVYKFKFPSKYKRKGFFLNKKFNKLKVGKVFSF